MTLAVIPARGGSTGLRRKNLLPDSDGVPLVLTAARAARDAGCTVVVSTDDPEIRSLAELDGHQVHVRGRGFAQVPVDEVVANATQGWDGPVLLVQPTVQPMTAQLIRWFLDQTGGSPTALGVEDRHIMWQHQQVLTDRAERQSPSRSWPIREMGVRWWPARPLTPPVRVATWPHPLVDIDTAGDYQQIRPARQIVFRVRANDLVGWGHLHRVLTLAEGLQHHDVSIVPTADSDDRARRYLTDRGWPTHPVGDVTVWDVLDTDPHRGPSVALEDTTGNADVTINAMYGHGDYQGAPYAVVRDEFRIHPYRVREDASRIMVLFGGTDPARLTDLALSALPGMDVDVIRPGDHRAVAASMLDTDLLITSGGRTVFEAATLGVPTLVMCQNMRELTHTHLGVGNLNLGLGRLVDPFVLQRIVTSILDDYPLRADMSRTARQSIDGRGAGRVRGIIEHVAEYGEKP